MGIIIICGECECFKQLEKYPAVKICGKAEVNCGSAVIIAGKNADFAVNSALAVIVDEGVSGELSRGVQLITCGVSPKNTVSITSRTDEKITLSLNRSIKTQRGVVEPLEKPVLKENFSEFDLMAAFCAKLLIDG